MQRIQAIISEIKSRVDCRSVAQEFGLSRRWGSFRCPFHDDTNPSLSVNIRGYRCFACGAAGDAFNLVMRLKGIPFVEAAAFLAARCGVTLPMPGRRRTPCGSATVRSQPPPTAPDLPQPAPKPTIGRDRRRAILTAFAQAGRLCADHAPHTPAFDYLRRRGISAATAVAAGLGAVTDYWRATGWLRGQGSVTELQAASLFNGKGNLRLFAHRLVIPYSVDGEVVMLQARNVSWRGKADGPKEITVGPVSIPFNADALLEPQDTVYICEGAIDTLSLIELGFAAIGIPGARSFRPEWVELFDDVGQVVVALDNDAAGHEGAATIANYFGRVGRQVGRLRLPDDFKDVNEFLTSPAV